MAGVFPFNREYLLGGPCRVLRAPLSESVPAGIEDIIEVIGPDYAPEGEWEDFGATTDGSTYGREFGSDEWTIEQSTSAVHEEINETNRTIEVPVGEISPEHLQIFEEGTDPTTITGTAGRSAQKAVKFGNITSLTQYRIAFIRMRPTGKGADITEPGSVVRGGFVCGVLYVCQLSADSGEIEMARGSSPATLPITFTAFPEDDLDEGEEVGAWFTETGPQTVVAGS